MPEQPRTRKIAVSSAEPESVPPEKLKPIDFVWAGIMIVFLGYLLHLAVTAEHFIKLKLYP